MSRLNLRVVLISLIALTMLSAGILWYWANQPAAFSPTPPVVKVKPTLVKPAVGGGVNIETPTQVTPPVVETQPAPPPVQILPMNAQRLERVQFNPNIGDVFRIVYDRPSGNLFMAVIEPDGMRSIWRMSSDLTIQRVLTGNARPGEIFLGETSAGVLIAQFADPGVIYSSVDRGETWQISSEDIDGAFWEIADNGQGTVWGTLHAYNKAILYRSTDDGRHWQEWKDFQQLFPQYAVTYAAGDNRFMLRHLHSVAYIKGQLLIGVGDVARYTYMSSDGGDTWQQVWDEGFTASVPLADGSGLLLGPDRLVARGLALYDLATKSSKEVWLPRLYGFSGYTYSMVDVAGSYFAAFHNETNETPNYSGRSGIVVSPDGKRWFPFLEFDKVTNFARTDIFMTPAGDWQGYVTLNGGLYRFEPPIGRWYEIHKAFGE